VVHGSLRWVDDSALLRISGQSSSYLDSVIGNSTAHYRERDLPKRGGGTRRLRVPSPRLANVQRRFHRQVFRTLTPHVASHLYRRSGTIGAAKVHVGKRYFYHGDIASFYPSVGREIIAGALRDRLGVTPAAAQRLCGLTFCEAELPQGAPTSPAIGEIALWKLDCRLHGYAQSLRGSYTRYADDIAISTNRRLSSRMLDRIRGIVIDEGFVLNDKGGLFEPGRKRAYLGIGFNGDLNVRGEYRGEIRRLLRGWKKGVFNLSEDDLKSLSGKIDWVYRVKPSAGETLRRYLAAGLETHGDSRRSEAG